MTPEHTEMVRRQISQLMQTLIQGFLISAEALPECADAHNCSGELIDKIVHIRNETRRLRPIPAAVPGHTAAILTRKAWLQAMPNESDDRPVIDIELISAWQQQQHHIHKLRDASHFLKPHLDPTLLPKSNNVARISKHLRLRALTSFSSLLCMMLVSKARRKAGKTRLPRFTKAEDM